MNTRLTITLLFISLLAGAVNLAQGAPDFSGTWVMDASVSNFGMFPMPDKYVRVITHKEPDLTIVTTEVGSRGERTSEVHYTTDGKECTNTIRGNEIKGTATWDGDSLLIRSKLAYQGDAVTIDETWNLSEDGKKLSLDVQLAGPMGSTDIRIVLDKQ